MWSNKYIGIPFKARGRDYSGVDCWGLVRLVYAEEYGISLPSFEQNYTIEDTERIAELIAQYTEGWEPVTAPEPGNIVLFKILGQATHVGIMLNTTDFLHSRQGYDVAIGTLTNARWSNRALGFYKYVPKTQAIFDNIPFALKTSVVPWTITEPTTLTAAADKLKELVEIDKANLILLVNNTPVPEMYWDNVTLQDKDVVSYRVVPTGGDSNNFLKMAILIVIAINAPQIAVELGLPGATSAATAAGTTYSAGAYAWGSAITIASTAGLNAIFPVRQDKAPGDPGTTEAQLMVEGGGNRANPYGAIPVVLGKIRLTPPLAAQNYITYPEERTSYLTTAVAWGFGPLQITNFKIGEANLSDYVIQDTATLTGYTGGSYIGYTPDTSSTINKFNQLYARDVNQPAWNAQELICDGNPEGTTTGGEIIGYEGGDGDGNSPTPIYSPTVTTYPPPGIYLNPPASSDTAIEVAIAFHMPEGMRKIKSKGAGAGESYPTSVEIQTQYKLDNGAWQDWETFSIPGNKKDAYTIVRTKTFDTPHLIQVQARRLTGDNVEDNPEFRYMHKVVLLSVTYTSNRSPIVEPPGCKIARSVYVIQAKDQISGQLEGINAIVQSMCRPVMPPYYSESYSDSPYLTATSNPAALFLHVLTHPANPQRIELADITKRIDVPQLMYWWGYCNTQRTITFKDNNSSGQDVTKTYKYEYNGVIAQQRSVLEILRDICAAGRASPAIIDGKWTITIDEPKTAITQHFSPQNSWGFEAVRMIPKEPDGLKITFYDEEQNYQESEIIVYNTGKNYANSTLFESIQLPGVTNRGAIVDHAKWHFAQGKLRREVFSINCDIEYLTCNRGDRVKVSHDVPAWGSGSARIVAKYPNNQNNSLVIKTSEYLYLDSTKTYNIRVRGKTGISTVFPILSSISFSGFTRTGNTITIQLDPLIVPTIPFESTDTISVECSSFSQINLTNQKVSVNRATNSISYTTQTPAGNIGFNLANGSIKLLGDYEYLAISNSTGVSTPTTTPAGTGNTNIIDIGDLFLFGEVNRESQDLLVLSVEPQDNKTARLTLVDYGVTPGYESNPTGANEYNIFTQYKDKTENLIYNALITLPPTKSINAFTSYAVPVITTIYSNDPAVEVLSPGTFRYNIKVSYATVSKDLPTTTKHVECQYYLLTDTGVVEDGIKSIYSEHTSNTITIPDVIVGQQYKIRLRYVTSDGIAGPWPVSTTQTPGGWTTHTVAGFQRNTETVTSISVAVVGKLFRITINSPIPANFKEFKIKVVQGNPNIPDFWNQVNQPVWEPYLKTVTTSNNIAEINILEFPSPRISQDGILYKIACRPIDIAGNESQSASALASISLTTIFP